MILEPKSPDEKAQGSPTTRAKSPNDDAAESSIREHFARTRPSPPPLDLDALRSRTLAGPRSRTPLRLNFIPRRTRGLTRIAAGIFVAVGLGLLASITWVSPSVASGAIREVQEAMAKTRSLSFEVRPDTAEGRAGKPIRVRLLSPDRSRVDGPGGDYVVADMKTGRTLRVDPAGKKARILVALPDPRGDASGFELYEFFREIARHEVRPLPSKEIEGVKAIGFEVEPKLRGIGRPSQVIRVWVDPRSKLPLRMEYDPKVSASIHSYGFGPLPVSVSTHFAFDEAMDPGLFSMHPPEGYQVIRERP